MSKILYQMGKYDNLTLSLLEIITEEVVEDLNHFLSLDSYDREELKLLRDKYDLETSYRAVGWR